MNCTKLLLGGASHHLDTRAAKVGCFVRLQIRWHASAKIWKPRKGTHATLSVPLNHHHRKLHNLFSPALVYFSFFAFPPFVFAVPRCSFARFLRCLPICRQHVSNSNDTHLDQKSCRKNPRKFHVRCCLLAFSILFAKPTRTSR